MYYQSRYHLSNGLISLALDSLTGELLELVYEKAGENLIKNHSYSLPQPFVVICGDGKSRLYPGDAAAIGKYPSLRPRIEVGQDGRSVAVQYGALWDGSRPQEVRVKYTIQIPEGKADSLWDITVENRSVQHLEAVRFPCVNGVYFGEDWKDDTLVFPHIAGMKIENPVSSLGAPSSSVHWRWQNYRYVYPMGNMAADFSEGTRGLEDSYSGLLSMKWMGYYGDGMGLYFACHDPEWKICTMRADTFGDKSPGMNFFTSYPLDLEMGGSWSAPQGVVALHDGDWHVGAKKYREFHRGFSPAETTRPQWFEKNPGLVAHYDFKYQNGGIVHRFEDIRRLLDEARDMGLNHLLLSGWHKDGFDHGFPEYVPDEDLGSENDLKRAIAQVTEDGGHVCFYINSRLANLKYSHLNEFIAANTVKRKDGSLEIEQYGTDSLRFAVECIGSAGWRKKLEDTVAYITGEIGTDGMYLDQLAMGYPGLCHDSTHDHGFGEWNVWYQKALKEMHRRRKESGKDTMSIIHEGVSDSYGPLVSGQLISTFFYQNCGAFPEIYRYTFPEQILVDMLYPRENLAMRPVHVGQESRAIMDRAFRTGMYYWVYDLVDDNSFTRDPKSLAYLKKMTALRKFWLDTFGLGTFRDEDYLEEVGEGLKASCFELEDGLLIACCNTSGKPQCLRIKSDSFQSAEWYTADSLPEGQKAGSGGEFIAPEEALSLLRIKY